MKDDKKNITKKDDPANDDEKVLKNSNAPKSKDEVNDDLKKKDKKTEDTLGIP